LTLFLVLDQNYGFFVAAEVNDEEAVVLVEDEKEGQGVILRMKMKGFEEENYLLEIYIQMWKMVQYVTYLVA
jgi:hypothetical protein